MCLFGLSKHIALKMVIKSTDVLQKTSLNFNQPQFWTVPTKKFEKWRKNKKNCNILGSKTAKGELLTLNYLPSSFTTLIN